MTEVGHAQADMRSKREITCDCLSRRILFARRTCYRLARRKAKQICSGHDSETLLVGIKNSLIAVKNKRYEGELRYCCE